MSQENVQRFHRIYEQWSDRHEVEPHLLAKGVEWANPPDAVERGSRYGVGSFNGVFDSWEQVRFEAARVIDCGQDVVALGQIWARGRGAGVEVARPHGQIWTFREGKVIRMRWFNSHHETLEAAGLSG